VSFLSESAQNAGRITGALIILLVAWKNEWLRDFRLSTLGSWQAWGMALALLVYTFFGGIFAYFGDLSFDFSALLSAEGKRILWTQFLVSTSEEFLYRGLILYLLTQAYREKKNAPLLGALVSALLFGIFHLTYLFSASGSGDSAVVLLNTLYTCMDGFWLAALVLWGGTLWPAIPLHLFGNAGILVRVLSSDPLPLPSAYARLLLMELLLVALAAFTLLKQPSHSPPSQ
jgi:membrane protease YdiL (CAAX protease family)